MALGSESSTNPDLTHLPEHLEIGGVPERDDRVVAVRHRPGPATSRWLRADQRAVLRALVTHLLPVDDGASVQPDIVVRYIDYLVANGDAGEDAPLALGDVYVLGCDLVQAHACRTYGHRVQKMTAAEQDQLVWDMLECSMDGFDRFSPAWFFNTLRRHIADAMQSGPISPN